MRSRPHPRFRPTAHSAALLHWLGRCGISETPIMRSHRYPHLRPTQRSAFAGYRFPPEVITLAVRWYLRFGLSYRDVEELLAERGIEVGPRHCVPVRPALCAGVRGGGLCSTTRGGGSLARGRDLSQGEGDLAIPVPGHRPVRPGHRGIPLTSAGRQGRTAVPRASDRPHADLSRRGHHRPVPGLPPRPRSAAAGGIA
jgi:hypothetical protein